jgi:tetratricopeptide (TPR) repeat protein
MRRLLIASILVLMLVAAGATLAWVSNPGARMVWQPDGGTLRVLGRGLAVAPRWAWDRYDGGTLDGRFVARTADGDDVTIKVAWHPSVGDYDLGAAPSPSQGLTKRLSAGAAGVLRDIPLACLVDELPSPASCPADATTAINGAVAKALGSSAKSVKVTFVPDAAGVRRAVLASIASKVKAPERRVMVLGLDGMDWDLVLPWVRQGSMPNMDRLMRNGTWGTMNTLVPTLSPLIWTTIATGVGPDRHGVLDFVEKDPASGETVPVTGRSRKVPAIWNMASGLGRTTDVVAWWATWPAERINGTMISDRLYYTLTQGIDQAVFHQDPPDMIYPADQAPEFKKLRDRAVRESDWQAVRYFIHVPRQRFAAAVQADRGMEDPVDGFRRILASTRTYMGAGLKLAEERPQLEMVYLEGTDTIGHLLARFMPPPTDPDISASEAALYAAAVPRYFQIVDRWIGRYLKQCPLSECAWVVVSDHGFKWGAKRPKGLGGFTGKTAPLWHDSDASFVVSGAGVQRRGHVEKPASVYDVTPTIAALAGLPPGRDWRGSPLPGVASSGLAPLDYDQLMPIADYRPEVEGAAPADPEFLHQLQALGYLGGGDVATKSGSEPSSTTTASARPQAAAATPPGPGSPTSAAPTRGELNNLGVIKINEKKYDEAEKILRQALALSPDYPSPHYNLRRIYMETKRYDEADKQLWLAVDKGLRDPERSVDRAAQDYDNLSLQPRAVALLTEAIRRFPDHEPFWVHLMVDEIRLGQCEQGAAVGARAAPKFPNSAPVHAFYGLAAACAGDASTARPAIERSLALNPNQPNLRQALSQLE